MTPPEQAARWLADVPRMTCSFDTSDGSEIPTISLLPETETLAAIARHLAPGDDLVAQAHEYAAMMRQDWDDWRSDEVADCKASTADVLGEAAARISALTATVGEKEDQLVSVLQRESETQARHDAKMETAEAEAAARLSALTAQVAELRAEVDRKIDPAQVDALVAVAEPMLNEALSAAEQENATLRDRLARMEGANATSLNAAEALADKYRDALQLVTQLGNATAQRIARAALTDGGTA